jgi:YHS domain-containing protein
MDDGDDQKMSSSAAGSGGHYGYHGHHHHGGGATVGMNDVVDPVCGATIDPHMTRHYVDSEDQRLFFCSSALSSPHRVVQIDS